MFQLTAAMLNALDQDFGNRASTIDNCISHFAIRNTGVVMKGRNRCRTVRFGDAYTTSHGGLHFPPAEGKQ
jgi:hypothetical protein